jgi:hypothetical protein
MCKISVLKLILLRAASCLPHLHKTRTSPSTKCNSMEKVKGEGPYI